MRLSVRAACSGDKPAAKLLQNRHPCRAAHRQLAPDTGLAPPCVWPASGPPLRCTRRSCVATLSAARAANRCASAPGHRGRRPFECARNCARTQTLLQSVLVLRSALPHSDVDYSFPMQHFSAKCCTSTSSAPGIKQRTGSFIVTCCQIAAQINPVRCSADFRHRPARKKAS